MEEYQQRVIVEKSDLDVKISKLSHFLKTLSFGVISESEVERMSRQLGIMSEYSRILGERIAEFK